MGIELTNGQKEAIQKLSKWFSSDSSKQVFQISGYAGCVDENTLVLTNKGNIPIKDIILYQRDNLDFEGFEDYKDKNFYKVYNGKDFVEISHIYGTSIIDGYEIKTQKGTSLKCSYKHPLMKVTSEHVYKWVKSPKLQIGDLLVCVDTEDIKKGFYYDKIIEINPIRQKFYDLTIPSNHTFIANNLVSHNTGKTTIIREFINEINLDKDSVVFATFTGKAALVLQQKNEFFATTIHKLIYKTISVPPTFLKDDDGNVKYDDNDKPIIDKPAYIDFKKYEDEYLLRQGIRLIVIDEGSMINEKMWKDLLTFDIPIVVLGDSMQLPPIGKSNSLLLQEPDIQLTEIMRQSEDSDIIYLSFLARNNEFIDPRLFLNSKDVRVVSKSELNDVSLNNADVLLCGKNNTRDKLNRKMREINSYSGKLPSLDEKIICRKNNWKLTANDIPLVNGMTGHLRYPIDIESIDGKLCQLDFIPDFFKPDDDYYSNLEVLISPFNLDLDKKDRDKEQSKVMLNKNINIFEYAYALTVHISQGSSWRKIILFDEYIGDKEFHTKWLYTGITRAEKKLILVTNRLYY